MAQVYVCLGSNVDRTRNISLALDELCAHFGELRVSSIYESDAVGFDGDPFFNVVASFDSNNTPWEITSIFRLIETKSGRTRKEPRFGPRTLDLDLLLYGDEVIDCDGLTIPRREIARYAFVLRPLAEIAGGERHPVSGQTFDHMWSQFGESGPAVKRVAARVIDLPESEPDTGAGRGRDGAVADRKQAGG